MNIYIYILPRTIKGNYSSLQVVPWSIISTFRPKVTQGQQQVTQPVNNQDWSINSEIIKYLICFWKY